jgi:hypothetical protein
VFVSCAYQFSESCIDIYFTHRHIRFMHSPFSNSAHPGRSFDATVDLTKALKDHYNPELAKQKLAEVHEWLKKDAKLTDEERAAVGWSRGYNLTTWGEFPGE